MTTVPSQGKDRSRHYQAWSAPSAVPNEKLAAVRDPTSEYAWSRRRQAENSLQNCSGAPRVSSSQQSTCSAWQHSKNQGSAWNPEYDHSPDEWASWITADPRKKLTIHVRRLCCSRALQTVQQRVPLVRTSVTHCSAAWSMAPAGYNLLPWQK